jgi:hypothetical protein
MYFFLLHSTLHGTVLILHGIMRSAVRRFTLAPGHVWQLWARFFFPPSGIASSSTVTEPPNYNGPHVLVIVIMTSDSRTYVPHNLKGLFSSEQDPITGVLQYYNSLFKIPSE